MLQIIPITGLPEIKPGDDLPTILSACLGQGGAPTLEVGDILIVTQKIVSKAENRFVDLSDITPSEDARKLAEEVNKPADLVELVLRESVHVVRKAKNVLITRHHLGHVMANAGIDASNIGPKNGSRLLLLPKDPDASAGAIAERLAEDVGFRPAVMISDSFGRPWRMGTTNVAIGISGMAAVLDQRGESDRDGREMQVTQIALADAVAAAAGLVMGEGAEGIPAAIARGIETLGAPQSSNDILRPEHEDLFR